MLPTDVVWMVLEETASVGNAIGSSSLDWACLWNYLSEWSLKGAEITVVAARPEGEIQCARFLTTALLYSAMRFPA
jgi:hypothetical protein